MIVVIKYLSQCLAYCRLLVIFNFLFHVVHCCASRQTTIFNGDLDIRAPNLQLTIGIYLTLGRETPLSPEGPC